LGLEEFGEVHSAFTDCGQILLGGFWCDTHIRDGQKTFGVEETNFKNQQNLPAPKFWNYILLVLRRVSAKPSEKQTHT